MRVPVLQVRERIRESTERNPIFFRRLRLYFGDIIQLVTR